MRPSEADCTESAGGVTSRSRLGDRLSITRSSVPAPEACCLGVNSESRVPPINSASGDASITFLDLISGGQLLLKVKRNKIW